MTTVVLVPGGWHGGWWFAPIVDRLRARGVRAIAMTPTGVGDRHHLASATVNLDTHIDDLCSLIEAEELDDVILCAHSYGGMIVTGAADRLADRIAAVVHIDAQVPDDGESLWDLTTPDFRDAFIDGASSTGYLVPPPPGLDPRVTPHPLASFVQRIRLTGASEIIPIKHYVWLSEWEDSPTKMIYDRIRHRTGWIAESWPIGHDVVGQGADRLETLLLDVARRSRKSR